MTNVHRIRRSSVLLALCAAAWFTTASRAAETMFIGDFEALERDWKFNADKALTVEGRVGIVSPKTMRFANSSLRVELPPGTHRFTSTDRVVVSGLLRNRGGRPVLEAFSIRPLPRTEQWLANVQVDIRDDEADSWFRVADLVRKRGDFYDDAALKAKADELELEGLNTLALAAGRDSGALRGVAVTARDRGLPAELAQPLLFRAALLDWTRALPRLAVDGPAASQTVRDQLPDDLPGALQPQPEPPEELAAAYRNDPETAYETASPDERLILDRLLYADVIELTAKATLAGDGSNADALAAELAESLPDRPDVVASYRERGADSLLDSIASFTEEEAVALAKRLAASRGAEKKKQTLRRWLKTREDAARLDGPEALLALARDTQRLIGDRARAIELAVAAAELDTRFAPARDWLVARGYERVNGKWRPKDADRKVAASQDEVGQPIEVGITAEQARQRAGILPDRTARLVSRGQTLEFWVYRDLGLILTIQRLGEDSRVIEIEER